METEDTGVTWKPEHPMRDEDKAKACLAQQDSGWRPHVTYKEGQIVVTPDGPVEIGECFTEPITTEGLLKIHARLCSQARDLMAKKNHDYAGEEGETPFLNFQQCENLKLCSTEAGLLVRLSDKLTRLACFVNSGEFKVPDERLEDTVQDVINYVILFAAYCGTQSGSAS